MLKVKFDKDLRVMKDGILYQNEFCCPKEELFFICDSDDTFATGFELKTNGEWYDVVPVYLKISDCDEIQEKLSLEDAVKDKYDIYLKDMLRNFLREVEDYVVWEHKELISFLKSIIEEHSDYTYYISEGNSFQFEVLDQFVFRGKLCQGYYFGNVVITDLALFDRYTDKIIASLPNITLKEMFEINEDEEEDIILGEILSVMSNDKMSKYIINSIGEYVE